MTGTGYGYVVSNLTDMVVIPVGGDGKYALPLSKKIGIYSVPEYGYAVTGNPYIIPAVEDGQTIDESQLPRAEKLPVAEVTIGSEVFRFTEFEAAWKKAHDGTSETPATLKMLLNVWLTNTMETVTQPE